MKKKIYWTLGVALVGFYLAQKQTYWFPETYLLDWTKSVLGILGGGTVGFLFGCIVEEASERKQRLLKVFYWLLLMAIVGYFLGAGKGVSLTLTVTVMACSIGLGLLLGVLQYFLQSGKKQETSVTS